MNTYLELDFGGFYQSYWSDLIDRDIEYELMETECDNEDELLDKLNFRSIHENVSKEVLNSFNSVFDFDFEFKELYSPREYNFDTDKIVIKTDNLDMDEVLSKVDEKIEEYGLNEAYNELLDEVTTSKSGYIAYYTKNTLPINHEINLKLKVLFDEEFSLIYDYVSSDRYVWFE